MERAKAPWHDYVMTRRLDAGYFASQSYDDIQIAYFTDYPILPAVLWTAAVWGALIAALLLLGRSRWARTVAVAALVAQLGLVVVTFGFMDRWHALGPRLALFDVGVLVLTIALVLYCRMMSRRGVLR